MNTVPDLSVWDALDAAECERIARDLVLPEPFRFDGVERHAQGGQERYVAFFDHNGDRFALLPGCENAVLGYDPDNPFVPTPDQAKSWANTQEEYDVPPLSEFLQKCMTPLRRVTIAPLLMEVAAKPFGRIISCLKPLTYSVECGSWHEVNAACSSQGLALPSSDEWEYACAAGTRTLFHWGNHIPSHVFVNELEKVANIQNAFGLKIALNSYHWEYCATPGVMCGGDGGDTACGGGGYLATLLLLASSNRIVMWKPEERHFYIHWRRVLRLMES